MFETFQLRGKGEVRSEWFDAEKIGSEILLTPKGKRDQQKAIIEKQDEGVDDNPANEGGGGGGGCG